MMYGLGKAERRRRIDEVLALVELTDKAATLVEKYSGGMKRRLEIARGLTHRPKVLFLDEPTLGLDAQTRRHIWDYVRQLNKEAGVTIILTTHYMEEADFLCDRVAIMDHGKFVALDTPARLKDTLGGDVVSLELEGDTAALLDELAGLDWIKRTKFHEDVLSLTMEKGERRIPELVVAGAAARRDRPLRQSAQAQPRGRLPPLHRPDHPRAGGQPERAQPGHDDGPRAEMTMRIHCDRRLRPLAPGDDPLLPGQVPDLRLPGHARLLPDRLLGLGFRRMPVPGMGGGAGYIGFLAPGIIGMTLLFSSSMQGMSVLWDKEFGFLKEIMVAPVSRVSLVLGRIAGRHDDLDDPGPAHLRRLARHGLPLPRARRRWPSASSSCCSSPSPSSAWASSSPRG